MGRLIANGTNVSATPPAQSHSLNPGRAWARTASIRSHPVPNIPSSGAMHPIT